MENTQLSRPLPPTPSIKEQRPVKTRNGHVFTCDTGALTQGVSYVLTAHLLAPRGETLPPGKLSMAGEPHRCYKGIEEESSVMDSWEGMLSLALPLIRH